MAESSIPDMLESAVRHHRARQRREAEAIYRQILARHPDCDAALHLLGVIAMESRRSKAAAELIRRAIAINPAVAGYYNNLGNALRNTREYDQAIAAYRQALTLDPQFAMVHYNLGNTLLDRFHFDDLDEVIRCNETALRLQPEYPEAFNNLSMALYRQGKHPEAIAACRTALRLKPDYAEAYSNLGNSLMELGDFDECTAAYREAIRLKPDFVIAHYNLAIVLLLQGDFKEGWLEHEWRLQDANKQPPRPYTHGGMSIENVRGKTLLVFEPQGLGDIIQFIRYAPMITKLGGRIMIQCVPELARLLRSVPDLAQILHPESRVPPFDVHCALMSLPLLFQTDIDSIPAAVPYLHPEPELLEQWRQTLGPRDGSLRVGLVWAGSTTFQADRTRSLQLDQLALLAAVPHVKFYSLQKGPPGEQAKQPPPGMNLIDLGPQLHDLADTAAVMSLLDLIITTDTSIPHLAGALARPVWVMLQFLPDWRWLLKRDDSPWYPTMRLFRQTTRGDWHAVIERVAASLAALAAAENK
jgi:Flp pilus assembly protein TadD